jgi:hypothetical protein
VQGKVVPGFASGLLRQSDTTGPSTLLPPALVSASAYGWRRAERRHRPLFMVCLLDDFRHGFDPAWEERLLTDEHKKRRRSRIAFDAVAIYKSRD